MGAAQSDEAPLVQSQGSLLDSKAGSECPSPEACSKKVPSSVSDISVTDENESKKSIGHGKLETKQEMKEDVVSTSRKPHIDFLERTDKKHVKTLPEDVEEKTSMSLNQRDKLIPLESRKSLEEKKTSDSEKEANDFVASNVTTLREDKKIVLQKGYCCVAWKTKINQPENEDETKTPRKKSSRRMLTTFKRLSSRGYRSQTCTHEDKEFLDAVRSNDIDKVSEIVKQGNMDINCHEEDGLTALHIACSSDNREICKILLNNQADLKKYEKGWGLTPLSIAAKNGSDDCLKLLLQYEKNPDESVDRYGFSALARAAHTGRSSSCKILLEAGANPLNRDNVGYTPFHRAAGGGYSEACRVIADAIDLTSVEEVEVVQSSVWDFTESVVNVDNCKSMRCACNAFLFNGERIDTPLHLAASKGHAETCKALCISKSTPDSLKLFNPNCPGVNGSTPLHGAIRSGHLNCVEMLIENCNGNPNISDADGNTALHIAVAFDRREICRYLCSNGADFELINLEGDSPWELALHSSKFDMMTILESGMKPSRTLRLKQIRAAKLSPYDIVGKKVEVQGMGIGIVKDIHRPFPFVCMPKLHKIKFLQTNRLNDVSTLEKSILLQRFTQDGLNDGTPFALVEENILTSNVQTLGLT